MSTLMVEKPTTVKETKPPGNPDFWVKAGETFEIKLDENPTTGYLWALATLPENFYLLFDSYVATQPIMAGSGGVHHFTFVAVKPKIEGNFVFYMLRPWEPFAPTNESNWLVNVK